MKYMKSSMKAMTPMKSKNMQDKKVHNYCKVNTKLKDWARNCNNVSKTTLAKKKKTNKWGEKSQIGISGKQPSDHCPHHWSPLSWAEIKQEPGSGGLGYVSLPYNDIILITRSSWVNCALRDEEAVYWVSVAHYEAVAVSN